MQGVPGITVIDPGTDRSYVGVFPIKALSVPDHLKPLLFGIGVKTCAELATLSREAVEVRLGADAVPLWKLTRADDDRHSSIFAPIPRELPHATLDWIDYEVTDPGRLLFVINALLENVCDALAGLGQGAREIVIEFALSKNRHLNPEGKPHLEILRSSRPTANRQTWMRLVRTAIERIELASSVTGIALRTTRVNGREVRQNDLFDRGLATAEATEAMISRLIDNQGSVVVTPENSAHHLLDRRTTWKAAERSPSAYVAREVERPVPALTLQLSPVPKPVLVETVIRREYSVPARFRDAQGWHEIVHVAGPDRVSGGRWNADQSYHREYFRCVTRNGEIIWLFRELKQKRWFLHGWWD